MKDFKILIACEESGSVRDEFTKLGFDATSCDLLPSRTPGKHYQGNVFDIINEGWDLMIAHPPCTFLSVSGAQWYYHPDDKDLPKDQRRPHPKYPNRKQDQQDGIDFFLALANCNIPRIAIENPVCIMSSVWRKPDQIIQPYFFGDEATKTTCLWLKNLPLLRPTNIVGKGERVFFESGKSHPKWYADALKNAKTKEERQMLRSKTFAGIAKAMADQWSQALMTPVEQ